MAHSLVEEFYRGKELPHLMNGQMPKKLTLKEQLAVAVDMLKSSNVRSEVDASRDPRLQGRATSTTATMNPHATPFSNLHKPTQDIAVATAATSCPGISTDVEDRIQELKDENMKLRTQNIQKDREISRLKNEVEQLRGAGYETGNERPRV
jgi:hypothetical protein